MATKNRYYYIRRNQIGIVEDYDGSGVQGVVNGVTPNYQNVTDAGLSIKYDAVCKAPHFDGTTIPDTDNVWGYEGTTHMDQTILVPEEFHDAIFYKVVELMFTYGYLSTDLASGQFDPKIVDFYKSKYNELVVRAKKHSREYFNGGTFTIKPMDF